MDELKLSRIQLRQNGEALNLQAAELKATVDELARQTVHMQEANAQQKQKAQSAAVEHARCILAAKFTSIGVGWLVSFKAKSDYRPTNNCRLMPPNTRADSVENYVKSSMLPSAFSAILWCCDNFRGSLAKFCKFSGETISDLPENIKKLETLLNAFTQYEVARVEAGCKDDERREY
jgi:hypothetical protein